MKTALLVAVLAAVASGQAMSDGVLLADILAPRGSVDSGQALVPAVRVYNPGPGSVDSCTVFLEVADDSGNTLYQGLTFVLDIAAGAEETLDFPAWAPSGRDSLTATAWTWREPESDTLARRFFVHVRNVAVTEFLLPGEPIEPGDSVVPGCVVCNRGNMTESFPVHFSLVNSTVPVTNLPPESSRVVVASDTWVAVPGIWLHRVQAELAGDMHPEDNVLFDTIHVPGSIERDVWADEVLAPTGFYPPGITVYPTARVGRTDGSMTFWTWFTIWDNESALFYHESLQVNQGGGNAVIVNYPQSDTLTMLGNYMGRCSVYVDGDQCRLNDVLYVPFSVVEFAHNVLVQSILAPSGSVDSGLPLVPTTVVQNQGVNTESFPCRIKIRSYEDVAFVLDLAPGAVDTIAFDPWRPMVGDSQTVTAWTALPGDVYPEDDTLSQRFFVAVRSVGIDSVLTPDTVAPGESFRPRAAIRNKGNATQSFDVELRVGLMTWWRTVTDLAPGNTAVVAFDSMSAAEPCSIIQRWRVPLARDPDTSDNTAWDTVWVVAPGIAGEQGPTLAAFELRAGFGGGRIRYSLSGAGRASLAIFSSDGRLVRRLRDGPDGAGVHELAWDGRDDAGRRVGRGVYCCRLVSDAGSLVAKLVLVE